MRLAVLTCGMLPIPAVQGGAVENLIDFYLDYNDRYKLHDITVYSPWNIEVKYHPALSSKKNHYIHINVTSLKARIERKIYGYLHRNEYYNYFIEYYFEKVYHDLKKKTYDYLILENCPGYAYKLSQRGYHNIILHLHNDLLHDTSRYHDAIFNSLTKIITVSDYIKGRVSTIKDSCKIKTIYNGINLEIFQPRSSSKGNRKRYGFSHNDFVMIYTGRINKEKGVSEIIDAMLKLNYLTNIKLLILGSSFFDNENNEEQFVRSLKEKSQPLRDRITFTGFIQYTKVPDYLDLADIAVLPSIWDEPFGLTIVEALAAGLPLITTRSGGIPEICEGVATIISREHIEEDLSTAILDLYYHPEKRKQMATASLKRSKKFGKETYAIKFFKEIEETIK